MKNNEEHEKAMAEFFANGGKIQYGSYRESGRVEGAPAPNPWGARKKAGRPPAGSEPDMPLDVEDDE
jgi:hypothetical protein